MYTHAYAIYIYMYNRLYSLYLIFIVLIRSLSDVVGVVTWN